MATTTKKPRTIQTYKPAPLPAEGFVRLPTILSVLQISKTSFINGVEAGRYPKGILLSPRTRVWPVEQIPELIDDIKREAA